MSIPQYCHVELLTLKLSIQLDHIMYTTLGHCTWYNESIQIIIYAYCTKNISVLPHMLCIQIYANLYLHV